MLLDGPTYCDVEVDRGTEETLSSRSQSKVRVNDIRLYVLVIMPRAVFCYVVIASSRVSSPPGASFLVL